MRYLFIAFLILIISNCNFLSPKVDLPGGYYLRATTDRNTPNLYSNEGEFMLRISEFMCEKNYVYGWVFLAENPSKDFFILDTKNNILIRDISWKELNHNCAKYSISPYQMRDAFTFLDILTGLKQKNW
jgi:hypothetical protein